MLRIQTARGTCVTVCAVGTCGRSDINCRSVSEFLISKMTRAPKSPDAPDDAVPNPVLHGPVTTIRRFKPRGNLMKILADFPSSVAKRPEVARVVVVPARKERNFRIVHLCNWHMIPRQNFEAVLKADGLETAEIDRRFRQHELRVESVQREQYSLMLFLVPELQLRSIHLEGLCMEDAERFSKRLRQLRSAGLTGNALPSQKSTAEMIRQERLLAGTAGQLLMDGILDVLPVEDRSVFEAASPFKSSVRGHNGDTAFV
jgi:hypothetical protein